MLDTPLGGVDTGKHVVPAQNHHVRYRTPWAAWTRENTRFQRRTTMLDTPRGGLYM